MKILLVVSAIIATLFFANSAYSEEFGLVVRKGENIFLYSSETSLKPDSTVQLLEPSIILRIQKPVEKNAKQASHIMIRSKFSTVYLLHSDKQLELIHGPTVAVILPLGKNEKSHTNYRYSNCTSNEGVHHNIYSVDNGNEKRLWSAYQYLPYEVEPSCTESEYAE